MAPQSRRYVLLSLLALSMSVGFENCAPFAANVGGLANESSSAGGGADVTSQASMQAYQSGLYAFANTQGCVACHASTISPFFASSDFSTAYAAATGNIPGTSTAMIDFSNPDASVFVAYSGNSHCGATACANPANEATVKSLVESWAAAVNANPGSSSGGGTVSAVAAKYVTNAVAVPTTIPSLSVATPAVLRFQLSTLNAGVPAIQNAIFEISLQLIDSGEYRVSNPRIAGNTAAVNITGIHVYVKTATTTSGVGSENQNQGNLWATLTATAAIFALPNPLPTGPLGATPLSTTALQIPVQSTSDMFTIGFDAIE